MGRGVAGYVRRGQEDVDDPARVWVRGEGHGADSGGEYAWWVFFFFCLGRPHFFFLSLLWGVLASGLGWVGLGWAGGVDAVLMFVWVVFETELMGIEGVSKDEL